MRGIPLLKRHIRFQSQTWINDWSSHVILGAIPTVLLHALLALRGTLHAHMRQTAINGRTAQTDGPLLIESAIALRDFIEAVEEDVVHLRAGEVGLAVGVILVGAVGRVAEVEHDGRVGVLVCGERGVAAEEDGGGGVIAVDEGVGGGDDGECEAVLLG